MELTVRPASLHQLREAQARLEAGATGPLRTLDPSRELATPLVAVHGHALTGSDELVAALDAPLAAGLAALALAQLDAFPGNLFWDLDLIAVAVVDQVRDLAPTAAAAELRAQLQLMAELQHLYGRATAINFTYVHDFVYGFDWAKWVAREPELHADPPAPFSPTFLAYMERRGHELLELIARDDAKYPSLDEDEPRNPFPFSRAPADEVTLHRELARRDLIPVPTWRGEPRALDWSTRWRVPFAAARVEVAGELGLSSAGPRTLR